MLTIDAIANKNTIEIIGLDIFQLMLVAYGVIQIQEIQAAFTAAGINDPSVPVLLDLIPMCAQRVASPSDGAASWRSSSWSSWR